MPCHRCLHRICANGIVNRLICEPYFVPRNGSDPVSEFFQSWRRKAGCVLLVMSAVFTCGLIRSCTTEDSVAVYSKDSIIGFTFSVKGITWSRYIPYDTFELRLRSGEWSYDRNASFDPAADTFQAFNVAWRWRSCGFDFGEGSNACYAERFVSWTVPYWSIVIPLTLLSAYLILHPGTRMAVRPTQDSTTSTSGLQS